MVKEIPLTRGQVALVDADWYELLSGFRWHCTKMLGGKKPAYAARRVRVEGYPNGRIMLMHRFILPPVEGLTIDHINGNGLDNRRANLRYCTIRQNNINTRRRRHGQSQYKGVTRGKVAGTWRANIYLNGRQTMLGVFNSEEEAAAAYNSAARAAHGEFARLNDVPVVEPHKRIRAHGGKPAGRSGIPGIRIFHIAKTDRWQVFENRRYIKQFRTLEEAQSHAATLSA